MRQQGFTLLELMVAMAIFAMLALAGWQVFDGVNRARERAQHHANSLAVLQYAYLQLQQDMAQIIPYQAPPAQPFDDKSSVNNDTSSNADPNQNNVIDAKPFMIIDGARIRFMRYADPDPRYQTSPSIQRIEYEIRDQALIRRQYTSPQTSGTANQNFSQNASQNISLDTVLLSGISEGRWQAYVPQLSASFPNNEGINNQNPTDKGTDTPLLPKGVGLSFTYQDTPISWQWALTPQSVTQDNTPINAANNAPPTSTP